MDLAKASSSPLVAMAAASAPFSISVLMTLAALVPTADSAKLMGVEIAKLNHSDSAPQQDPHRPSFIESAILGDEDFALGRDWLDSNDLLSGHASSRRKRATGTSLADVSMTMSEQSSSASSASAVDVGDSYVFEAVLDLPGIADADKGDISIEVFAIDLDSGLAGFHICQTNMNWRGGNVQSVQSEPIQEDFTKDGYPTVIEKTRLLLQDVHTGGIEDTSDANKLKVTFEAIMVNTDDLQPATNYYLSVGAEYGNADSEYVWVGQAEVTSVLANQDHPAAVTLTSKTDTLEKGDTFLFKIEAFITEPSAGFQFGVFQPLGDNDVFHIGKITRTVGSGFGCSNDDFWEESYTRTPSGRSVNNATLNHPYLINHDSVRSSTSPASRIQLEIPIHVLDVDELHVGVVRTLAFGLIIGNTKLWTALHDVTILASTTPPAPNSASLVEVNQHNNLTAGESILAGNAAIFSAKLTVPVGWCDFDVTLKGSAADGVTAIGARISDSGFLGLYPDHATVTETIGDTTTVKFGAVRNAGDVPSTVLIEVYFATDPASANKSVSLAGPHTVGNMALGTLTINIMENTEPKAFTVQAEEFGFDDNLFTTGQAGINMIVSVPPGAGAENIFFEAVPDFEVTDFTVRLCRLQVTQVGPGLPCVDQQDLKAREVYSKSNENRLYDDFGQVNIDRFCPANYPGGSAAANQFHAKLFYELPFQANISTTSFKVNGGVRLGEETIWVSSRTYNITDTTYSATAVSSSFPPEAPALTGPTAPFVMAYPQVTTRDRTSSDFMRKEPIVVTYIVKIQPLTRGDYEFIVAPPSDLKVCKLVVTHIGDNLPCVRMPPPSVQGDENMLITYVGPIPHNCGSGAKINFKGLTSFGTSPLINDLTPDADSIQIQAFFQVCDGALDGVNIINHSLDPLGRSVITGTKEYTVVSGTLPETPDKVITGTTYKSLLGPDDKIYKTASKILEFKIPIPEGYMGSLEVVLINDNYADDVIIDFCDMALVGVGDNMPCVHMQDDATVNMSSTHKVVQETTIYDAMVLTISGICYMPFSPMPEDDLLTVEAAIRIRDDLDLGSISLILHVIPNGEWGNKDIVNIPLTVSVPADGDIPVHELGPDEASITLDPTLAVTPFVEISSGQKQWVPFFISFPPDKTLKMEASVLLPSNDGKAILHATDIKFGTSTGKNILCVSEDVDLQRVHKTVFQQTSNLTTFMQIDSVTTDLGYVTNAGFTMKQNKHVDEDDVFSIKVEVQLADHILAADNATFDMYFAVQFGHTIVVATQKVMVARPRSGVLSRSLEVGDIVIEAEQQSTAPFYADQQVHVSALLYHSNLSMSEGYPGRLRVMSPNYLAYTSADSFVTNYTLAFSNETVSVEPDPGLANVAGMFDFVFPGGLTYPDILTLNFTMTVDPDRKRRPGTGEVLANVVLVPVCEQNVIDGYPASANLGTRCGSHVTVTVKTSSPECFKPIAIDHECQVQASTMLDTNSMPWNAIDATGTKVWSPAVRTGFGWREHLEFDFLGLARINRLRLGGAVGGFRSAVRIRVQAGSSADFFSDVTELDVPENNEITFDKAVVARFVRIVLVEVAQVTDPEEKPIGITGIQWFGCMPEGFVASPDDCGKDRTVMANDVRRYRHFAVDDANEIVYFCDRNPYLEGMFCYASNRGATGDGTNTWTELPRYVNYIEGFSPGNGRMYFGDKKGLDSHMSSRDGETVELTDVLPNDLIQPVVVPGETESTIDEVAWTGGMAQYTANFAGLMYDSNILVQWKSCCS